MEGQLSDELRVALEKVTTADAVYHSIEQEKHDDGTVAWRTTRVWGEFGPLKVIFTPKRRKELLDLPDDVRLLVLRKVLLQAYWDALDGEDITWAKILEGFEETLLQAVVDVFVGYSLEALKDEA